MGGLCKVLNVIKEVEVVKNPLLAKIFLWLKIGQDLSAEREEKRVRERRTRTVFDMLSI